jgi:long-chain acyl-CoA synthetase
MGKILFLTGGTGFVGGNLIPHILNGDPATKLIVLLRANSDREAEQRLHALLWTLSPQIDVADATTRIKLIRGDITSSRLGLSESVYNGLAAEVTHIIHSAATVQFQLPLPCARLVNCEGTKKVIELAQRASDSGKLQHFAYVSTAYVSGTRGRQIYEHEFDRGQQFANTYEQTKFEAEGIVRQKMHELPITIFRPSIIVGDSKTGKTTSFNVLYPALKLIYSGILKTLPGSPDTPMDVVPIDYVVHAIHHIFLQTNNGTGKTYHLTASERNATSSGEIVDRAVDYFNQITPTRNISRIQFLPPETYEAAKRCGSEMGKKAFHAMDLYEPYLCVERVFDNTNTRAALADTGVGPPDFKMYYQKLLEYCIETDWGRPINKAA